MTRSPGIDAEIGAQFHGATNALGNIYERAVREDCRVKGCKEVVPVRHHAAQVFAHQFGVFFHRLADGAEDDALLLQFLAKGCLNAHRVHHSIHSRTTQCQTFFQGDAQLIEGLHQLGVYFSGISGISGISGRGIGIVADILIVYLRHLQVTPSGSLQRLPVAERLQSKLQQPLGFPLLPGDQSHHILRESFIYHLGLYIGSEAVLVLLLRHLSHKLILFFHSSFLLRLQKYKKNPEARNLPDYFLLQNY